MSVRTRTALRIVLSMLVSCAIWAVQGQGARAATTPKYDQGIYLVIEPAMFVSDGLGIDQSLSATHLRIRIESEQFVRIEDVAITSDRMEVQWDLPDGMYALSVLAHSQPIPRMPGYIVAAGKESSIAISPGEYSQLFLELDFVDVQIDADEILTACEAFTVTATVRSIFEVKSATFDALQYRTSRYLLYDYRDRSPVTLNSYQGTTSARFEPIAPCSGIERIWFWIMFYLTDEWAGDGMEELIYGAPHPPGSAYIRGRD